MASFPVRDHVRFNLGIIRGPGSFAVLGSFADPYKYVCEDIDGGIMKFINSYEGDTLMK